MTRFRPRESLKLRSSVPAPSLRGLFTGKMRRGLPRYEVACQDRSFNVCLFYKRSTLKHIPESFQSAFPQGRWHFAQALLLFWSELSGRGYDLPQGCFRFSHRNVVGCRCGLCFCSDFQEGAVEAVLRLCKTDYLILRGYCSAVLKQFAATPVLREKLVARGGVSGRRSFTACKPVPFLHKYINPSGCYSRKTLKLHQVQLVTT